MGVRTGLGHAGRSGGAWPALAAALLGLWLGLGMSQVRADSGCPPPGHTAQSLQQLKAAGWALAGPGAEAERHALALALLGCLGDADPQLRDALAFEALQAWMRASQIDAATLRRIGARLQAALAAPADAAGFVQPFSALVLAEVARVDRLQPFLTPAERAGLVDAAARYLAGVRDLRGFDPGEGWRHGVAHGADLALQLSLNPALDRVMGEALRQAVAAQVMPLGAHAWRHGEPDRLMAPVFYLGRRPWWSASDWQAWFDALAARRQRGGATTLIGLAQRHNLSAFLSALYVAVQESPDAAQRERLLPGLRAALRTLD